MKNDEGRPDDGPRSLPQLSLPKVSDGLAVVRHALGRDEYILSPRQRRLQTERTKEGLARARARGVKLGRPSGVDDALRARIFAMRETMSLAAIARTLTAEGVPTAQAGAKWHASTIAAIVKGPAPKDRSQTNTEPRTTSPVPRVVVEMEYEGPVTTCIRGAHGDERQAAALRAWMRLDPDRVAFLHVVERLRKRMAA